MKKFLIITLTLLIHFSLKAQVNTGFVGIGTEDPESRLTIEGTSSVTSNRTFLTMRNNSNDTHSATIMKLHAGTNSSWTGLYQHSDTYVASPNSKSLGVLWNNGGGLLLKASDTGLIKFETGSSFTTVERMRIDIFGNIGIGTSNPKAKLQISQGDVYIENIGNGIIMKDTTGGCWRYTPDSLGNLKGTSISCPN